MKKLKDPASCLSFFFSFFTSFLAVMKKAGAKKELENSTLLNPSSTLFSTDGQAQPSVKELYSRALFNLFIVQEKKKERRRKKMKPILTVLQRAPSTSQRKETWPCWFNDRKDGILHSEVQLPVFWPGLFLTSVNR